MAAFAADANSGASSGNQGIGQARDDGARDSEANGFVAQHRAPLSEGRTGYPVQTAGAASDEARPIQGLSAGARRRRAAALDSGNGPATRIAGSWIQRRHQS